MGASAVGGEDKWGGLSEGTLPGVSPRPGKFVRIPRVVLLDNKEFMVSLTVGTEDPEQQTRCGRTGEMGHSAGE